MARIGLFPAWQKLAILSDSCSCPTGVGICQLLQSHLTYFSCFCYLSGFWSHLSLPPWSSCLSQILLSHCSRNPGWTSIASVLTSLPEDFLQQPVLLSAPQQVINCPFPAVSKRLELVHKYPSFLPPFGITLRHTLYPGSQKSPKILSSSYPPW